MSDQIDGRTRFELLGVDPLQELLYVRLVDTPSATLDELVAAAEAPRRSVAAALGALENSGLAKRTGSRPAVYVAVPPDAALDELRLRRLEALDGLRAAIHALSERYRQARPMTGPAELVRVVTGPESMTQHLVELLGVVRHELRVFDAPPYSGQRGEPNSLELDLLRRGVRMRVVYARESFVDPANADARLAEIASGEQARVVAALPMKLFIADDSLALCPMHVGGGDETVVLVRPSSLLDGLLALFETYWRTGLPIQGSPLSDSGADDAELPDADRRLLLLMLTGMKDAAIAKQLGVSHATLERRIKRLLERAGVETRFQLASRATARGWLPAG